MNDWKTQMNITAEDMPNDDLRIVAEQCGVEVAMKLLEKLGGMCIYVPKFGVKNIIRAYLANNPDDRDPKRISQMFEVSMPTVYRLLREIDGD